ncbi:CD276 antigen-like isoform X2 [Protopterus annectens]|uniref:CD276 antigen-like isoform X2 n=1 Tax=Protopterus annectens TaxID=7888 RepID=UPI001CFBE1B2|nr:CD276 antigen-like isoform X2 [Protopterus annectens]
MKTMPLHYLLYSLISLSTCGQATSFTGNYNHDVILPYSYKPGTDFQKLVVTWQRKLKGSDLVVHSYYYGRNQLERQHVSYLNRTQLFLEKLHLGNASLKLKRIQLDDAGEYICSVNTDTESFYSTVELHVGATYEEPHLMVGMFTCGKEMHIVYQTGGGYPEAEVEWLMDTGKNITELSNTTYSKNSYGLYDVTSKLRWAAVSAINCTFIMTNKMLNQTIVRSVTIRQKDPQGACCQGISFQMQQIPLYVN